MMVVGMCVAMSLYATLVNHGTGPTFWADYIRALGINLPVAFVAQLLVVGPLVRMLHLQIFKNSQLSE